MPARAAEESLADVDEHARYGREFRSEAERRKIANYTLSAVAIRRARTWDTANWPRSPAQSYAVRNRG